MSILDEFMRPKQKTFFSLTANEVAVEMHKFLHDAEIYNKKVNTLLFYVARKKNVNLFTLIIIYCKYRIGKKDLMKELEKIPDEFQVPRGK